MWCQQRNSFAHRCRQSNSAGSINSDERRQRAEGLLVDNFVPKPEGQVSARFPPFRNACPNGWFWRVPKLASHHDSFAMIARNASPKRCTSATVL